MIWIVIQIVAGVALVAALRCADAMRLDLRADIAALRSDYEAITAASTA